MLNRPPSAGIYGHTSDYHGPTQSIYVFGGVVYSVDHTLVSDTLHVLHMPSRRWSRLPPDERANPAYTRVGGPGCPAHVGLARVAPEAV